MRLRRSEKSWGGFCGKEMIGGSGKALGSSVEAREVWDGCLLEKRQAEEEVARFISERHGFLSEACFPLQLTRLNFPLIL